MPDPRKRAGHGCWLRSHRGAAAAATPTFLRLCAAGVRADAWPSTGGATTAGVVIERAQETGPPI
jgi:hypothetical protein